MPLRFMPTRKQSGKSVLAKPLCRLLAQVVKSLAIRRACDASSPGVPSIFTLEDPEGERDRLQTLGDELGLRGTILVTRALTAPS